jgi:hypothetical protein
MSFLCPLYSLRSQKLRMLLTHRKLLHPLSRDRRFRSSSKRCRSLFFSGSGNRRSVALRCQVFFILFPLA